MADKPVAFIPPYRGGGGGGASFDNPILAGVPGTASQPFYAFSQDPHSGMFQPSIGSVSLASSGATALTLDSNQNAFFTGNVNAAGATFSAPVNAGSSLTVAGLLSAGSLFLTGAADFYSTVTLHYNLVQQTGFSANLAFVAGDTISARQGFFANDGAATSPSYTFTSDPTTGLYWSATNTLNFAANSARVMYLDPNQVQILKPLHGTTGDFTGALSALNLTATNAVNAASLTLSGAANITGTLTGGVANFTTLGATTATFGTLNATSFNPTHITLPGSQTTPTINFADSAGTGILSEVTDSLSLYSNNLRTMLLTNGGHVIFHGNQDVAGRIDALTYYVKDGSQGGFFFTGATTVSGMYQPIPDSVAFIVNNVPLLGLASDGTMNFFGPTADFHTADIFTNTLTTYSTAHIEGALNVDGASTINGGVTTTALSVGGNASVLGTFGVGGTLGVTGATSLSNTLNVTGTSTLAAVGATNLTLSGTATIAGATTINAALTVNTGLATFNAGINVSTSASLPATQFNGNLFIPAGAVGTPSISFVGNTNTGMYSPATNNVAFATNGTQALLIGSTQLVTAKGNFAVLGTSALTGDLTLSSALNVAGLATFNGNITQATGQNSVLRNLSVREGFKIAGATSGFLTFAAAAATANYTLNFPAAQGGSGQVLSNDGAGNFSWVTPGTTPSFPLLAPNGSVTAPSYSFTSGGSGSGLYQTATGTPALAANGIAALTTTTTGAVTLPVSLTTAAATVSGTLTVNGATAITAAGTVMLGGAVTFSGTGSTAFAGPATYTSTITQSTGQTAILGSVTAKGGVRFQDSGTNYVAVVANATTTTHTYTLPATQGSATTYLQNDGAGNLTWAAAAPTFPLLAPNGSATTPSYAFTNGTGTGLYLVAANRLGLASNGIAGITFDTSANVSVLTNLSVGGTTSFTGVSNSFMGGVSFASTITTQNITAAASSTQALYTVTANSLSVAGTSSHTGAATFANAITQNTAQTATLGSIVTKASLAFQDSTSNALTITPNSTITSHSWTLPGTQGAANTFLKNDGTGVLSWANPTFSFPTLAPNGTAAAPSYAFTNGTGTGLYLVATNRLGLASNGIAGITFDTSANVTVATNLTVSGTTSFIGASNSFMGGVSFASTITTQNITAASSSTQALYTLTANSLSVASTSSITGAATFGSTITATGLTSAPSFKATGAVGSGSFGFTSASFTGMYQVATDWVSIATAGTLRASFDNTGVFAFNGTSFNATSAATSFLSVATAVGSAASPGYNFASFTNYGMWQGTSGLRFSVAGTEKLGLTASAATLGLGVSLVLSGATSGTLTHAVPATVTSYTLTWPAAQGAANTVPVNNGSGTLTWSAAKARTSAPVFMCPPVAIASLAYSYSTYGLTPTAGSMTLSFSNGGSGTITGTTQAATAAVTGSVAAGGLLYLNVSTTGWVQSTATPSGITLYIYGVTSGGAYILLGQIQMCAGQLNGSVGFFNSGTYIDLV